MVDKLYVFIQRRLLLDHLIQGINIEVLTQFHKLFVESALDVIDLLLIVSILNITNFPYSDIELLMMQILRQEK